ncbi:AP2 domain family protein [Babesia bovis T2Bo]|uniref:Uncharacterized protein n=1 Tax=Babesia bovis TaxID=5865 RepID=A7AWL0_BABBO|nr:AP2 domain family protein [Babesia bovis T2Bo]EDO05438.1 AP2 domain family protein [Babesia bovis T2Bo]|eukprot:XP_001609006.1 hypothetical protein [Babesia bovis T2Bo]
MFRDEGDVGGYLSQSTSSGDAGKDVISDSSNVNNGKLETVLYCNVPNKMNRSEFVRSIADANAVAPSSSCTVAPEGSSGAIMPLNNIRDTYNRMLNQAMYYGNQSPYSSLPSQSAAAGSVEPMTLGTAVDNQQMQTLDMDTMGDVNGCEDVYDVVPNSFDRSSAISDVVKLNDAITELTKRMPMPPTQELLNAIDPHLSMRLQLTYLRAYIQNQQLLIDMRNRLFGNMVHTRDFKNAIIPAVTALYRPNSVETRNYTESYSRPPDVPTSMHFDTNSNWFQSPAIEYSMPRDTQDHAYNSEVSGDVYSTDIKNDGYGSGAVMPYQPFMDVTGSPQHKQYASSATSDIIPAQLHYNINPALPSLDSVSVNNSAAEVPTGTSLAIPIPSQNIHVEPDSKDRESIDSGMLKPFVASIPPEAKNVVKYDTQKHAFVAIYLGPLGARRRRLFSIRKFGVEQALKLATDFAVGSSSAAVASKERRLLEEVCMFALQSNPNSGTKIEHVEAACNKPEARGLVFSCGAQLWMTITYDSSTGEREMEAFSVESLGFEGAYQAAVAALDQRLQNGEIMTSKLSGPLYFWLESGGSVLCLMVTSRDLMRLGPNDQEIYIGRFDVKSSGGFYGARKLAQKWRSDLRNQLIY